MSVPTCGAPLLQEGRRPPRRKPAGRGGTPRDAEVPTAFIMAQDDPVPHQAQQAMAMDTGGCRTAGGSDAAAQAEAGVWAVACMATESAQQFSGGCLPPAGPFLCTWCTPCEPLELDHLTKPCPPAGSAMPLRRGVTKAARYRCLPAELPADSLECGHALSLPASPDKLSPVLPAYQPLHGPWQPVAGHQLPSWQHDQEDSPGAQPQHPEAQVHTGRQHGQDGGQADQAHQGGYLQPGWQPVRENWQGSSAHQEPGVQPRRQCGQEDWQVAGAHQEAQLHDVSSSQRRLFMVRKSAAVQQKLLAMQAAAGAHDPALLPLGPGWAAQGQAGSQALHADGAVGGADVSAPEEGACDALGPAEVGSGSSGHSRCCTTISLQSKSLAARHLAASEGQLASTQSSVAASGAALGDSAFSFDLGLTGGSTRAHQRAVATAAAQEPGHSAALTAEAPASLAVPLGAAEGRASGGHAASLGLHKLNASRSTRFAVQPCLLHLTA